MDIVSQIPFLTENTSQALVSALAGFGVGLSLILAIGAQNAFVLKQGLQKRFVFLVCFICSLSDSVLIVLGVTGFSKIVASSPLLVTIATYAGAVFLFIYGAMNFKSAWHGGTGLKPEGEEAASMLKVTAVCLAFTWLNPHVYLDTVVLMGSVSVNYQPYTSAFAIGAVTASWVFFFSLGYGARLLLPVFSKPKAWQILDFVIGCIMWLIAASLVLT